MIIKTRDSKNQDIAELQALLDETVTSNQRFLIERELKSIKAGVHGEDDAAYFIDFYFSHSKNWAVIHDLRIEHNGQVAQIDHLLINRMFEFYVLESKSYAYGVKINDIGEFEALYQNKYFGIPSPIEQNKRHITLLEKFIKGKGLLPKRLGIRIQPTFRSFILVAPKSIIRRPDNKRFDTSSVIKADTLKTVIDKEVDVVRPSDFALIAKIVSGETVKEVAEVIASYHLPAQINFKAKFGIEETSPELETAVIEERVIEPDSKAEEIYQPENSPPQPQKSWSKSKFFCAKCKASISDKVAKFCFNNKNKFGGKAYCFDCQNQI
jgi:hypothetical protein